MTKSADDVPRTSDKFNELSEIRNKKDVEVELLSYTISILLGFS